MNKTICLVSPSLNLGGIERALVVLADFFARSGCSVTYISLLAGPHFYKLNSRIKLIEPHFFNRGGRLGKILFYPLMIRFIRKNINRVNPDAILTFGDVFNSLVLLSVLGLNYPIYISDRTSPEFILPFPIPLLKRWLYPKSAGFIAQTKRAEDFKKRQFGDKLRLRVIPNALREVKIYPNIERKKIILYVGRFSWEKCPARLIEAFNKIPERKGWTLHMAGSGPQLDEMKQLALSMGINKEVLFYGKVHNVDLLYAHAGIFVLPSLLEGYPNSLCEAMATGLPCICFDTIPYEELFTNGVDGLAISGDDSNSLTNTLMILMGNEQLRKSLGSEAQKSIKRLNVDKIGQKVLDFIFEG